MHTAASTLDPKSRDRRGAGVDNDAPHGDAFAGEGLSVAL